MELINFPIERINHFLDRHTFSVALETALGLNQDWGRITVKIKLTGVRPMISVGEWKDFIEYTMYIEDIDSDFGKQVLRILFSSSNGDYVISNDDTRFYFLTSQIGSVLSRFLKFFDIDNFVSCKRIVYNLDNKDTKTVTEGRRPNVNPNLFGENLDYIVEKLVEDVMSVYQKGKTGSTALPEDFGSEMVYEFPDISGVFSVNVNIIDNPNIKGIEVDGEFNDEDTIDIEIQKGVEITERDVKDLEYELNEIIVHELVHMIQLNLGYKFRKKDPEQPYKYYSQKHELEAQIAGFKRRARLENKPFEELLKNWLKKYVHRHRMNEKEVIKLSKLILSLI